VIVKVPQITKILSANNVDGLSLEMFVMELIGYTICATYGYYRQFPFSTYGEVILIGIQNVVIVYLIFQYRKKSMLYFSLLIAVLGAQIGATINGLISDDIFSYLYISTAVIFSASKLPQIITNFRNKSTGALAFTTFLLLFSGSCARVFTTFKEVNETSVLFNYLLGAVLNGTILIQILVWGSSPNAAKTNSNKNATKKTK